MSKKRTKKQHTHLNPQQQKRALFWELIARKQGLHIRF